jgi:hypothetical protein
MANLLALIDVTVDPDDFDNAHAEMLRLKVDRNGTRPGTDAWRKAIAEWGNWVDDLARAFQRRLYALDERVTALESNPGGVESVVEGAGINVDITDPANPVVASTLYVADYEDNGMVEGLEGMLFDQDAGFVVSNASAPVSRISLSLNTGHIAGSLHVLERQNTTTTIVSDSTAQTLYTTTVPANTLAAGSRLVIEVEWDALNTTGSSQTFAWTFAFGGTTLHAFTNGTFPNNALTRFGTARFLFHVRSASEIVYRSQIDMVSVTQTSVTAVYGTFGDNKSADQFGASDMFAATLSNALTFTWTHDFVTSSPSLQIRKLSAIATVQ